MTYSKHRTLIAFLYEMKKKAKFLLQYQISVLFNFVMLYPYNDVIHALINIQVDCTLI